MRIYLKDLPEVKQKEIKDLLKEFGIDANQVVFYRDGERIVAEAISTGDRYTLNISE